MIKNGAIESIVQLAKMHPLNEKILAAASSALSLLLAGDPSSIQRMIRAGGAVVAVEAIITNMDDADNLTRALNVLASMAVDAESVRALLAAGALDAILTVGFIRTHALGIRESIPTPI